jgi:chromosome segregation ATPase
MASKWTVDLLYEHLIAILEERDKAVRAALAASEKALERVAADSNQRFASVNEFRGALDDQARLNITRAEVEASMNRLNERIQELTDRVNKSEGKGAGLNAGWLILAGAIPVIIGIITVVVLLSRT